MTYLKHIHITNTYITIYSIKFASIHIARNMNSDNLTNVISYNSFCLALSWALFSYHIVCNPILYPGFLFLFSIDTVFPLPPTKCMRHMGLMPVFPHLDFWFIVLYVWVYWKDVLTAMLMLRSLIQSLWIFMKLSYIQIRK